MAKFMEVKSISPSLKQCEIAKKLAISTSTLQRFSREIKVHSLYRILQSSNTTTREQKTLNQFEYDLKMTPNDLKMTSNEPVKEKKN